jgi:hypothetical protein
MFAGFTRILAASDKVRCAVFNGMLRSGFGQLFQAHANQNEKAA